MIGLSGKAHDQTSDLLPLGERCAEWTIVIDRRANIRRIATRYGKGVTARQAKLDTPCIAALYSRFASHKAEVKER